MTNRALILNSKSGGGFQAKKCRELVQRYAPDCEIFELHKDIPIEDQVLKAYEHGAKTIIAAGGDGTLSSVASAIMRLQLPLRLGILPAGTLNHFAKDLNIPIDLEQAFQIAIHGKTKLIDIAEMNDKYFINNSSLGLYPIIVKERESLEKKGWKKWPAFAATLFSVLKRHPYVTIEFKVGDKTYTKKTSFVFIGNNKYAMTGFNIGSREKLDEGSLTVVIAHYVGRFRLFILGLKALAGTVLNDNDFNTIGLQECSIRGKDKRILVSYDGEVSFMAAPLHYKIIPKALSVIVPE